MPFDFSNTKMNLEGINKYFESQGIKLTDSEQQQINTIFQASDTWDDEQKAKGCDGVLNATEAALFVTKLASFSQKIKGGVNNLIEGLGLEFKPVRKEIEATPVDATRVTNTEKEVINAEKVTDIKELILKKPKKIDANTDVQSNYEWSEEKFADVLNIMLNSPKYGGKFKTSVLQGKAKAFIESGKKYNIDPRVLVAIAMQESARGTSTKAKENNNVGGIAGGSYKSIEDSIDIIAETINRIYNEEGAKTINQIGPTGEYCAKKVGTKWSAEVSSYLTFFNKYYKTS